MELTVLVDNNTIIDHYFLGEPALSFYIETNSEKILFDVGYSDIFLKNLAKLNLSIDDIQYLVLSHGHYDHTGGINSFMDAYKKDKKPFLVAHEAALNPKTHNDENIGIQADKAKIKDFFNLNLVKEPFWINDNLVFLGQIPRKFDYEATKPIGKTRIKDSIVDDFILDDSALAYNSKKGIVIITGCSHSGICNICEYAKEVLRNDRISDIIGGFHLSKKDINQISSTVDYLKKQHLHAIHPCHCTCLDAKVELAKHFNVKEIGVGYKILIP